MTKLDELVSVIRQKHVFIQTHNFPDPDAIASAFGLQRLLKTRGIDSTICYKGKIDRLSLRHMLEMLKIHIVEIEALQNLNEDNEVILVDAQKGNTNIIDMVGQEIACIDHHPTYEDVEYSFKDIRKGVGACASIIAEYFYENNIEMDSDIATALMYGIKVDTANMCRGVGHLDLEVFYKLFFRCNQEIIAQLDSCNLQFDDLSAYATAIKSIRVYENMSFANTGANCPEPLVASVSDFMLALAAVEFSVVYSEKKNGIKLSIRSSCQDMDAGLITMEALKGIGSGGGHAAMAGGFVPYDKESNPEFLIDEIQERYIAVVKK